MSPERLNETSETGPTAKGGLPGSEPPLVGLSRGRERSSENQNGPAAISEQSVSKLELTAALKELASSHGFSSVGICPAVEPPGLDGFHRWLDSGYAGQMHYLSDRREAYAHPEHVLQGARSVMMLAMNYRSEPPQPTAASQGRIAQYAWGEEDYHDLLHGRLKSLVREFQQLAPDAKVRGVVDTAPLLEREFAQLGGLGWIGKNTLLLNKTDGSYFFLAALLTDRELVFDEPFVADHCGTCRACLDACPTDAFLGPRVLDASRCISYLTIELREPIPVELRSGIGEWLFGCDVCQEVCPWNRRAPITEEASFMPQKAHNPVDLFALFDLDEEAFRQRFRRTPMWRSKRRGLLRNAAIVLGNQRPAGGIELLGRSLHDEEPLIRGAAAWALGQYQSQAASDHLQARCECETDATVRQEIEAALAHAQQG